MHGMPDNPQVRGSWPPARVDLRPAEPTGCTGEAPTSNGPPPQARHLHLRLQMKGSAYIHALQLPPTRILLDRPMNSRQPRSWNDVPLAPAPQDVTTSGQF